jgi:hypothetical protein
MAVLPLGAPKKPANQGGKAAAYVAPLMEGVPAVTNTANMPHQFASLDNNWQAHGETTPPGGYGGSGNGAS